MERAFAVGLASRSVVPEGNQNGVRSSSRCRLAFFWRSFAGAPGDEIVHGAGGGDLWFRKVVEVPAVISG